MQISMTSKNESLKKKIARCVFMYQIIFKIIQVTVKFRCKDLFIRKIYSQSFISFHKNFLNY